MKEITSTYSELRVFSEKVMSFVRNGTLQNDITLSSRIAADCTIGGDDIDLFLYDFSKKFSVDFSNFEFEEHFYPEGEGFQFFPISLFSTMVDLGFQLLILPFRESGLNTLINSYRVDVLKDKIFGKGRKDLMVKDLVASAILGEFQLKENIKFIMSK